MAVDRRRVHFEGRVQGVGFRFTAARLAQGFPVSGTVKNLDDGRVELDVQGEGPEVAAFLASIRSAMGSKIRRVDESPLPTIEDESPGDFHAVI